jgi:hypothetical protein
MSLREYSNFLVFEGVLESIGNVSPIMSQLRDMILYPHLKIVEADCNTFMGRVLPLTPDLTGEIEVSTGVALTKTRINYLYSKGIYTTQIRSINTCTSIDGICTKCFSGTLPEKSAPEVGSIVSIPPRYILSFDIIIGNGHSNTYTLNFAPEATDTTLLFINGILSPSNTYDIQGNILTTLTPLPINDIIAVKNYGLSTSGLLGFFARSYSGAVFGIHELPTYPLPIRQGLYETVVIPDAVLDQAFTELEKFPITSTTLEYYGTINSNLEKALFLLYNYAIYSSIQ